MKLIYFFSGVVYYFIVFGIPDLRSSILVAPSDHRLSSCALFHDDFADHPLYVSTGGGCQLHCGDHQCGLQPAYSLTSGHGIDQGTDQAI